MSCLNDDRATFNDKAQAFDADLAKTEFDAALQRAFDQGLEIDEIAYIVSCHVERTVRRYIVQDQLKKAANKDKN